MNTQRINFSALVIAITMSVGLNGTMLMGFDHLAATGLSGTVQMADTPQLGLDVVELERVVVVAPRAV